MYDFGGMNTSHRPIRCVTPFDGHPVSSLSYSPTGSQFVVGTLNSKIKIYDREAVLQLGTVKGDPYIIDVTNTKGHISAVSLKIIYEWYMIHTDFAYLRFTLCARS